MLLLLVIGMLFSNCNQIKKDIEKELRKALKPPGISTKDIPKQNKMVDLLVEDYKGNDERIKELIELVKTKPKSGRKFLQRYYNILGIIEKIKESEDGVN